MSGHRTSASGLALAMVREQVEKGGTVSFHRAMRKVRRYVEAEQETER